MLQLIRHMLGYFIKAPQQFIIILFVSSLTVYAAPSIDALPSGGAISEGMGTIVVNGTKMQIFQNTDKLAINWHQYNIGAAASVIYQQPDSHSITLNRVLSADPSQIYGQLSANGKIILINPQGVVIGPDAKLNVGAMIISTLMLSNSNFLVGNYRFDTPSVNALSNGFKSIILNQGNITTTAGGFISFIAPNITNQGILNAPGGTVGLLARDTIALNLQSTNNMTPVFNIDISFPKRNSFDNKVAIIQNGIIDVSAPYLGGNIYIDAGNIGINHTNGTLISSSNDGRGGRITLLGDKIALLADSQIDVSGEIEGGTVLIGRDWQGQWPYHASSVYIAPHATIKADGINMGNGGQVFVLSKEYTGLYGKISTKSGLKGGHDGQIQALNLGLSTDGVVSTESYYCNWNRKWDCRRGRSRGRLR